MIVGRRNQAAGGADAGDSGAPIGVTRNAVAFRLHVVLRDRHLALDHALDAPQAAVIVNGVPCPGPHVMTTAV